MTSDGKIARLPRNVREELNRRLKDGEEGASLVAWLNSLPAVKTVLKFAGGPINEQNLSAWRQGGYQNWLAHQKLVAQVEQLVKEDRTQLINRQRARCARFAAAARREEGEYPSWIFARRATQSQQQSGATRRADFWRAPGGVAPQSQGAAAMLLRRALPAVRQKSARPLPIYEMGSKELEDAKGPGTEQLAMLVAGRYVKALAHSHKEPEEQRERKVRMWRSLCQDVMELRKLDQDAKRLALEREGWAVERKKLEEERELRKLRSRN